MQCLWIIVKVVRIKKCGMILDVWVSFPPTPMRAWAQGYGSFKRCSPLNLESFSNLLVYQLFLVKVPMNCCSVVSALAISVVSPQKLTYRKPLSLYCSTLLLLTIVDVWNKLTRNGTMQRKPQFQFCVSAKSNYPLGLYSLHSNGCIATLGWCFSGTCTHRLDAAFHMRESLPTSCLQCHFGFSSNFIVLLSL